MNNIRAFVALEMPEPIRQSLADIGARMKLELSGLPLRWVPIQNMHLTLKFLGDVKPDQVEEVTQLIGMLTKKYSPFSISLNGLGAFPNTKRARVLWVGLETPESLNEMAAAFESAFVKIGFQQEGRPFAPHLTLARVRGHARLEDLQKINEVISSTPTPKSSSAIAGKIIFFQSELRPGGSVYNPLAQFVLSNEQEPS